MKREKKTESSFISSKELQKFGDGLDGLGRLVEGRVVDDGVVVALAVLPLEESQVSLTNVDKFGKEVSVTLELAPERFLVTDKTFKVEQSDEDEKLVELVIEHQVLDLQHQGGEVLQAGVVELAVVDLREVDAPQLKERSLGLRLDLSTSPSEL